MILFCARSGHRALFSYSLQSGRKKIAARGQSRKVSNRREMNSIITEVLLAEVSN